MAEPNDGVKDETVDDGKPTISMWQKEGRVFFVINNSPLMETEDGRLAPGMGLTPHAAVEIAHALLDRALKAMEEEDATE